MVQWPGCRYDIIANSPHMGDRFSDWYHKLFLCHPVFIERLFQIHMNNYVTSDFLWNNAYIIAHLPRRINPLRPRPNGRHFADDIFKCSLENENGWISPRISLKFVPKVRINNILALVQIMAWRLPGDKPLSGPMMVSLLTHICVIRPQWVNRMDTGWELREIHTFSVATLVKFVKVSC